MKPVPVSNLSLSPLSLVEFHTSIIWWNLLTPLYAARRRLQWREQQEQNSIEDIIGNLFTTHLRPCIFHRGCGCGDAIRRSDCVILLLQQPLKERRACLSARSWWAHKFIARFFFFDSCSFAASIPAEAAAAADKA